MKKRAPPQDRPHGPFNNPFGGLSERLGMRPAPEPAPEAPTSAPAPVANAPTRAVVRLERKGRGGKEATIVERLALPAEELAQWASELKAQLGCGGAVEGETLVLQGDQRERVRALLEGRGVRRVTVG